jgi:pyridoxal phosphate enzyme (YggS family)
MTNIVANNLNKIKGVISEACKKSDRQKSDITIVAVTKYTDALGIESCINAGLYDIGENKVQQAIPKIEKLNTYKQINWHFIGHLQTNKVKYVLPYFSVIHSLDRISLAKEINIQANKLNKKIECLIQVNVANEDTKFGVKPEKLFELAKEISQFNNIKISGLMTMAPYMPNAEDTRSVFSKLRVMKEELESLNLPNFDLQHLSMGMSNDYAIAIEEGATIIRLGRVLLNDNTN